MARYEGACVNHRESIFVERPLVAVLRRFQVEGAWLKVPGANLLTVESMFLNHKTALVENNPANRNRTD